MNIMKDNIPILKDQGSGPQILATDQKGSEQRIVLDRDAVAKTNPLTGEVTIIKNGQKFKVGYKERKQFASKFIDKQGFRAQHEANLQEAPLGQNLRRNRESEDRLWRQKQEEADY